jgi:hypothetical protein
MLAVSLLFYTSALTVIMSAFMDNLDSRESVSEEESLCQKGQVVASHVIF